MYGLGQFIWIPWSYSITASSQFHASNWTTDDLPEIIPPLGAIWAIRTPLGLILSTALDSAL